ncbi:MAG TPA: hypothetical protein GX730_00600 [Chloroflexi bacterium]|jgi:hypothetical protein|nr:hypothetical protein [Anaerolineaceae bacterium]HHX07921.1 hypothetical protein [Chloroflexota bacterium]
MEEKDSSPVSTRKNSRGVVGTVIVLAVMALALIVFVMINERTPLVELVSQTQTAQVQDALLLSTMVPCEDPEIDPVPINPVVNVNGIVIMGGALVLIVLAAVLREALLTRKEP